MADDGAHQHCCAVAGKTAPGASPVADSGHQQHVYGNHHHSPYGAHDGAPQGLVRQLIPERQIEVDAHEYLRHHHYGHYAKALPVGGLDEVPQQGHIYHYRKERQQRKGYEVFHSVGQGCGVVAVSAAVEDDGLVGIAERLGEERHYHRNLYAGAVDSQLHKAFLARHQLGKEYLVCHLVEDSHKAEDQQGPGVGEHPAGEFAVKTHAEPAELGDEPQRYERRAGQVGKEDEADAAVEAHVKLLQLRMLAEQHRQHQENEEVEQYVGDDERKLERHELDGPAVEPQLGEHNGLECIQPHYDGHAPHIFRMVGIPHRAGNRFDEHQYRRHKEQRHCADHLERGAVHGALVFAVFVGEAEHGGLHPEGEQRQQQRGVGVEVGYDAVAAARRRYLICI